MLYGTYLLTPAGRMQRKINKGVREAVEKYQEATRKLQQTTADGDQAIQYIKDYCYSYLSWVPGGRQFIDAAFQDIETLRTNHRDEVNQIIVDTYKQFQTLSKSNLSLKTGSEALDVLADMSKKLGNLADYASADILDNHPQIKARLGRSLDQLKEMGEQYGPEAKEKAEKTMEQIKEIVGNVFSSDNLDRARRVLEEAMESVKKLGDEAWKKGLEQAKPYLDKNPKAKALIEDNAGDLKRGNAKELFEKAKDAVDSGNLASLEEYVKKELGEARPAGSRVSDALDLDQYFKAIPNGSEVLVKIDLLKEAAEKEKREGEKLLRDTMDEIKQVLEKRSEKAKEIVDKKN
jgi:hypothetical protein